MSMLHDHHAAMPSENLPAGATAPPGFGHRTLPTLELAGIAGLGAVVAIHSTELASKVDEVQYLGAGYVALIAASLIAIVMLAVGDRRRWALAGLTAGAARSAASRHRRAVGPATLGT